MNNLSLPTQDISIKPQTVYSRRVILEKASLRGQNHVKNIVLKSMDDCAD